MDLVNDFFSDDATTSSKASEIIEPIIGIDLGTSNSCCCIWRNQVAEVIPDEYGNRTIPSVVAMTNKSTYIGHEARNQKLINPRNVFYEMKRLIGKKMDDTTVIGDKSFLVYDIRGDDKNNVRIVSHKNDSDQLITPEELSSYILIKLKQMASEYLKMDVRKAVVAVPAYFNDAQRHATRDAMNIAGLECQRIISEPIASALAYGLNKLTKVSKEKDVRVVVYDLGGGTLDISLMTISDGVFEVIGSAGNTHLGGVDFDNRLCSYCENIFKSQNSDIVYEATDVSKEMIQKLHKSCESAKKILSTSMNATIGVMNYHMNRNLIVNITREKFNDICNDLMILCLKPLSDLLASCEIGKTDVDEIIMVGGMTRVPMIRDNVYKFFGKCPNTSINPDEIVAIGAAIQGYIISHKSDPFSESVTLVDTTPLSLGVETIGGVMNIMIPRNATIPISEKRMFTNDTSNESSVMIKVYEGERKMTRDNFYVGEFELSGMECAPRGYHKIEVTFTVDIDGMITVTAEDLRKSNKNIIRINGNRGRLTKEEIDKMVETSKTFEQHDKIEKKKKKHHYELMALCETIMKNIEYREHQLNDSDIKQIVDDINRIKEHLKAGYVDIEEMFYVNELKRCQKEYCILITKLDDDKRSYKSYNGMQADDTNGTSVFQDDEDDPKTYVKIMANELGMESDNLDKLNELQQIKTTLVEMCHSAMDIIESPYLTVDEPTRKEMSDYVEDMLVWIHVQQKLTYDICKSKIDELNEYCNQHIPASSPGASTSSSSTIISSQSPQEGQINNGKNELTVLCNSLQSSIQSNLLAIDDETTVRLNDMIDDVIEWMKGDVSDEECYGKVDELNGYCNTIYERMVGGTNIKKCVDN